MNILTVVDDVRNRVAREEEHVNYYYYYECLRALNTNMLKT